MKRESRLHSHMPILLCKNYAVTTPMRLLKDPSETNKNTSTCTCTCTWLYVVDYLIQALNILIEIAIEGSLLTLSRIWSQICIGDDVCV